MYDNGLRKTLKNISIGTITVAEWLLLMVLNSINVFTMLNETRRKEP